MYMGQLLLCHILFMANKVLNRYIVLNKFRIVDIKVLSTKDKTAPTMSSSVQHYNIKFAKITNTK